MKSSDQLPKPARYVADFPAGHFFYLVKSIPRNFAGRTKSMLHRAELFAKYADRKSTFVIFEYSAELAEIEHNLRVQGLDERINFVALHDFYPGLGLGLNTPATPPDHLRAETALGDVYSNGEIQQAKDDTGEVYHLYQHGLYLGYYRLDWDGRLVLRDHYNANRGRIRRDEYRTDGTLRRQVFYDLRYNVPRQEIHYRVDGTPAFNVWLRWDPKIRVSTVERVTVFDVTGMPRETFDSLQPINNACLDALVEVAPTLVGTESMRVGTESTLAGIESALVGDKPALASTESALVGVASALVEPEPRQQQELKTDSADIGAKPAPTETESTPAEKELAFLISEDRYVDPYLLPYRHENARRLFLLHNSHIRAPYDDYRRIRPTYLPLFTRRKDADAIIFLTKTQRADAEKYFGASLNFHVLGHAIRELPAAQGIPREPDLAVMMAYLEPRKQVDHALHAWAQVVKSRPKAQLEIYGLGPDLSALQQLVAKLELGANVKFCGFTKSPQLAYQRASICLMTSRYEGQPLTLMEAMSLGCPVISYDLRYGPADIVIRGKNGYLAPFGNYRVLAKRIVSVLKNPKLAAELSVGALTRAQDFTEATFLTHWSELLR